MSMKNILKKIAIFVLEKTSTLEELKIAEKKSTDPKKIAGGIGYYEYLPEKVENAKAVFKSSRFVYKEYTKEHNEWFELHGFKKPYPKASLGVNLTLRKEEIEDSRVYSPDELAARKLKAGTKVEYAKNKKT